MDQEALDLSRCPDWDRNAEDGSQNGSQSHTVHQSSRDKAFSVQGLGGTPGGTRIPNLLIRSQISHLTSRTVLCRFLPLGWGFAQHGSWG